MFKNFFKGLARAFTIPKATRAKLAANPITPIVQGILATELQAAIVSTVNKNVNDPAAASAITDALGHAIGSTGIFN
jgi:hypothetical protein